jgi:hypothetical protein
MSQTLEQSIIDLNNIRESGAAAGWLGATAQLHLLKVQKSLEQNRKGASKTLAEVQRQSKTPVLDKLRTEYMSSKELK